MIRSSFITVLVALLFFSCGEETHVETDKRVASFEVEGMVCEMGCGASLRKGLYETNAVDEIKLDYKEERLQNIIHVYYDASKVNASEMLVIIEKLNEGQFKAKLLVDEKATSDDELSQLNQKEKMNAEHIERIEANTKSFSFPNLIDLFNNLIQ